MRDYDIGDEVVFIGKGLGPTGPGPFFCAQINAASIRTRCGAHGIGSCEGVLISGAGVPCAGFKDWCAIAWKKAPKGREVECGKHVERLLREPA